MKTKIRDKTELEAKKAKILAEGIAKLQVLTDFDRILTKAYVNGEKIPSAISILRNGGYISPQYSQEATALADHYMTIEKNLSIPLAERKKKMQEWWTKHFDLLIRSGLNKKHLEAIVADPRMQFRDGALEFLDLLHEKGIPLVVISSSGVGDTIPMLLEKYGRLYDNIHIITNNYSWNAKGNATEVSKPVIHILNKNEGSLKRHPNFKAMIQRKNIVLLEDSLGDLGMVGDFHYETLASFGFLEDVPKKNIQEYKSKFDVVLTDDPKMDYITKFLRGIK